MSKVVVLDFLKATDHGPCFLACLNVFCCCSCFAKIYDDSAISWRILKCFNLSVDLKLLPYSRASLVYQISDWISKTKALCLFALMFISFGGYRNNNIDCSTIMIKSKSKRQSIKDFDISPMNSWFFEDSFRLNKMVDVRHFFFEFISLKQELIPNNIQHTVHPIVDVILHSLYEWSVCINTAKIGNLFAVDGINDFMMLSSENIHSNI